MKGVKNILSVVMIVGFIVLVGTAGTLDHTTVSISEMKSEIIYGFSMLCGGYVLYRIAEIYERAKKGKKRYDKK